VHRVTTLSHRRHCAELTWQIFVAPRSIFLRKRYGDDRAGCELTIGADVDLAAKRRGW
jgi:hypothetical protein